MSNIPWNRQESTMGYVENFTMAVEPKELTRQYRAMVGAALDLRRSNEEIGAALKSRERRSRCSCRQTISRNLTETQRQVRKLDERFLKIGKDEDELTKSVLKLKTKIDGLYEVLTSKNNTHVASKLTGSLKEEDSDESDKEMPADELQHLDMMPTGTNEMIDTDNYSSMSESLAETGNVETERLSNSLSKKYYDAGYTENVAVFGKEQSNVRWFDGLYRTSDTDIQNILPENGDNHLKCDTVPFHTNELHVRQTDLENPNDSNISVSRTNSVKDLERVVTDQHARFKGNRPNIPQTDQTHLKTQSKSDKETTLKERTPYTNNNNNISVDRNEETKGIYISSRRHSDVTCKPFSDTDETIPAHSQNVPGHVTLKNGQHGTVVEDAPKHVKPPKLLNPPPTKAKYKRIFTSSMNDNRINFKTGEGFLSVAAGEYLEYPPPKDSNIKVHSKTPLPDQGATVQKPHNFESTFNDWGQEQTGSGPVMMANRLSGPSTVLCLDLTENMKGRAYQEMISTAKNIVTGVQAITLGTEAQIRENIAITVFGYETKVIAHLTNEYHRLLTSLDMLTVGGPGDMKNGLMQSVSAFSGHTTVREKDVQAKIVLISDGRSALERPPSSNDQHSSAAGNVSLWSILNDLRERAIRVFCIPVGEARLDVFEKLCVATQGRIIHQSCVHKVIKMSQNIYIAMELALNFKGIDIEKKKSVIKEIGYSSSDADSENILEQIDFIESHVKSDDDGVSKHEYEEFDDSMPEIGSRVRRGPHWKWENQDSDGAGTVVGHNIKGMLWVHWDNGISNRYHYGPNHLDVVVVDEPRRLFNDLIAVGCVVKRGINWRYDNQDGGTGAYGVVIRVVRDGTVKVRWQNKQKYMYKFGCDGLFEVAVCEPHEIERAHRERRSLGGASNIGSNGVTTSEVKHQKSKETEKRAKEMHKDKNTQQAVSRTDMWPTKENLLKPPERSSTKEQSSPIQRVKSPTWQYLIKDKDSWCDFPSNVQEKIEKDYNRNTTGTTLITMGGTRYRLAFASMTYHNIHVKGKTDLKIRRKD